MEGPKNKNYRMASTGRDEIHASHSADSTAEDRGMQDRINNVDSWLDEFEVEYANLKSQFETARIKIRIAHKKFRMEAIQGDPRKAAAEACEFIERMRTIARHMQETLNAPIPSDAEIRQRK